VDGARLGSLESYPEELLLPIAAVDAFPVSYPEPNDHDRHRAVCLVRLTDDEGRTGWGECTTYWPEAAVACGVLVEALRDHIVGRDAVQNESIMRGLKSQTWWYGTGGVGIAGFALSGIDVALWDLKGKVLDTRVLDLLGGPAHERLPAIASSHATGTEVPEMAEEIASWLATGLTGVKIGFGKLGDANLGFEHDRDVAFMAAVREAVGPSKRIMIDCGVRNRWTVPMAVARVRAFEEYRVDWIEEPLGAEDPDGYAQLRQATQTLIAYGEREWSPAGVKKILDTGTVDVVGLDPGRVGGVTGFAQSCDLLEVARRQGNAHAWSTAVDTAASLALTWAKPVCHQLEEQPFKGPMQADLIGGAIVHHDGYMDEPQGPGLGIEVDQSVVDRYRIGR
jgi:L-alanine-DL-glutamate epimerase-like enolase superfamily enzyme